MTSAYGLGLRLGFEKSAVVGPGIRAVKALMSKAPMAENVSRAAQAAAAKANAAKASTGAKRVPAPQAKRVRAPQAKRAPAPQAKKVPAQQAPAPEVQPVPIPEEPQVPIQPVPQVPEQVGGIPTSLPELHGPGSPGLSRLAEAVGNPLYGAMYHLDPAVQRAIYRTFGGQDVGRRFGALAGGIGLGSAIKFMGEPDYPDLSQGGGMFAP